jgi:hypothetical protein
MTAAMDVYLAFDPLRDKGRAKDVATALEVGGCRVHAVWDEDLSNSLLGTGKSSRDTKSRIRSELKGRGVTMVLIGRDTAAKRWIQFAIRESLKRGHALVGVYVHGMPDEHGAMDLQGKNPLDRVLIDATGKTRRAGDVFATYDWSRDAGRAHALEWVKAATTTSIDVSLSEGIP